MIFSASSWRTTRSTASGPRRGSNQARARLTRYFGASTSVTAITNMEMTKYTQARLEGGSGSGHG